MEVQQRQESNLGTTSTMKSSGVPWLGDIPDVWEVSSLSQIAAQVKERNDGLREKNLLSLSYGRIKRKPIDTIGGLLPAAFDSYNIIEANDIVLRLTDLQNDQHSLRVGLSHERGIITSAYTTLRPSEGVDARSLFYLLYAFDILKGFYGMGAGVRQSLKYDEVKVLPIAIPPLPEQRAVADYLDEKCGAIDAAIAEAKKGIEEYKAWKKSLIFEAVTGKKRVNCIAAKNTKGAKISHNPVNLVNPIKTKPSGIPWLGDVPEEWEIGKIGALYTHRNEKVSDKEFPPLSVTMKGVVPQLATAAKSDDGDNRKLVCKGDFAINSRSDRRGSCGISAYDGSVSLINTILTPRDEMNPVYYNWLFHTEAFADEFYKWGHGIVDDLWTTRWSEMKRMVIPLPPLAEQRAIADYLDRKCAAIDTIVAEEEALIADLEAYKKSLIYETVTGKREVA